MYYSGQTHLVISDCSLRMQEGRKENDYSSATTSAASTPHHSADADAAAGHQNTREITRNEDLETENGKTKREDGNQKTGNGAGYEALDAREAEEARRRAQQPSEYEKLQ